MTRYRVFYTSNAVNYHEEDSSSNSVAFPAGGVQVQNGQIENIFASLEAIAIDVSYFWKNALHDRILPNGANPEFVISDHPTEPMVNRRAFAGSLFIDHPSRLFRFGVVIRHFSDGNHIPDTIDDEYVPLTVSNSTMVDDGQGGQIGEYDFFLMLISSGMTHVQIQNAQIPILDQRGLFNNIY